MVGTATVHFKCPHCDALYQIVKAEAGPETALTVKYRAGFAVDRLRPAMGSSS